MIEDLDGGLDEWRNDLILEGNEYAIKICHGRPRCFNAPGSVCQFCYTIAADDPRSSEQVLRDMERVH